MQKIPTLFLRDLDDMRRVLPEVSSGCEWVLAGEGVATRKYDGTCTMLDEAGVWWARREVKPGRVPPDGFVALSYDAETGKSVGWQPMFDSAFNRWHREALEHEPLDFTVRGYTPGTYELCGPKVNGNPERFERHTLVPHEHAEQIGGVPRSFEGIRATVLELHRARRIEGLVFRTRDGRMAKIKARDFPRGA